MTAPDMPKRPRQHILETISGRRFACLLPEEWVIETPHHDYGVDLDVHVFEGGQATGMSFGVQLKSTDDAPNKHGKIQVGGVNRSTLNLWRERDAPVLVVLYSTPVDRFYSRWASSYDDRRRPATSKKVIFNFRPDHVLDRDSLADLPTLLRFFRGVRQADFRDLGLPLRLSGGGVQGHSLASIEEALNELVESSEDHLFWAEPGELAVTIHYDDQEIRAALPGDIATATVHVGDRQVRDAYRDSGGAAALATDGIVNLAWIALSLKNDNLAVELLLNGVPGRSRIFHYTDVLNQFEARLAATGHAEMIEVIREGARRMHPHRE